MNSIHKSLKPGYSYIELMFAVLIIALIIGLAGPQMMKLFGRTQKTSTKNMLKNVKAGIQQYKADVGSYPQNLRDLIVKPEGVTNWEGPYVGEEPNPEISKDAWGNEPVYRLNERGAKPPFELYSQGDPDKEEDRIDA